MGQRSQIYIRYNNNGKTKLIGRYFQWNFAERMVSRARYSIGWILAHRKYLKHELNHLIKILEVNFDMHDIVDSMDIGANFTDVENNDGKLFIDIPEKGKIKYCFSDCNASKVFNGDEYMEFDTENCYEQYMWKNIKDKDKRTCRNIKWISKHAQLMTDDELKEFITTKYEEN